jgi:four helix bundle protein
MESKLEVWKLAHLLTLKGYQISKNFPPSEKYGLTSQVRRSSSSAPTNIIKGQGSTIKKSLFSFYILQKNL